MAIAVAWLAAVPARSAPTLADYGNLPRTQLVSISPSGDAVALRRTEGDSDLVIVVSLRENRIVSGTNVAAVLPRQIYFISDSELILVASEIRRMRGYRGKLDLSSAFVLDTATGEIRQLLTPGDRIYRGQSGLGRIVGISKDGRFLYMPAFMPPTRGDRDPELALMKVEIASPAGPAVFRRGLDNTLDFFISADEQLLAIETYDNAENVHELLARRGRNWALVFRNVSDVINVGFVGVTPDAGSLVVLHEEPDTGRTTYSTLSLSDGSVAENLFGRDDADVETVVTDINRVAHGVAYAGFHPSYRFFDDDVDQRIRHIQSLFPEQSVWLRDFSDDWKHLVVYVEGSAAAGDYYLFSEGREPKFLAAARPNFKPEDIQPIGRLSIKARDGLEIPTILTVPRADAESPRKLPAIMLPHGGPQSHDQIEFDWMAQAFASQGYLVIQPQFRGSDGFGAEHLRAGFGEWGRKMQDDLTDTLQFLVDNGFVDPSRVCIVGASYGGYAALAGGAFTPDLYQCVVSISGVSDLPDMLGFERKTNGKDNWIVSYFEHLMVKGEATRDKLKAISPSSFADDFSAPVLLIHGEDDITVPYAQSSNMYGKLRRAGKDVQLVKLRDENHGLTNSENRRQSLETMIAFVNEHIGNARTTNVAEQQTD